MTSNDFRLITLGRLALLHPDGTEDDLGKRRRKLAVLAVLAMGRKSHSRDALIEMFWGEQEETKARHSLSDVLSNIRRVIRPDCILTTANRVELAPDAPLSMDTNELEEAVAQKKWSRVIELYGGDFLDGVTVPGSITFDNWVSAERERLRMLFLRACGRRTAILAEDNEWPAVVAIARRWLDADPLSADAAVTLLGAYRAIGTLESLREAETAYRTLNERLVREFDAECDDRVSSLAAAIAREEEVLARNATPRAQPAPHAHRSAVIAASPAGSGDHDIAYNETPEPHAHPRRRGMRAAFLVGAGMLITAAAIAIGLRQREPATAQSIAIVDVQSLQGDSADAWLEMGLAQMIASDLGRSSVPPERVRQVRQRILSASSRTPTMSQLLSIGRGVGASSIVSGGFTHGGGQYVLNLTVHDASSGKVLKLFTVSDTSVIGLADAAAARLAGALPSTKLTAFADVETPSMQAYQHYIRYLQETDVGRSVNARHELDAAVALDSGLIPAIHARLEIARNEYDTANARRLRDQITRHPERGSQFDRLTVDLLRAEMLGERSKALLLARTLASDYPRDPRAQMSLANTLMNQGQFTSADSVWRAALALDSLGMESGTGPCAPCTGYGGLAGLKLFQGKPAEAEPFLKRWIELQPDAPVPWALLGDAYRFQGRFAEAFRAHQHAYALSGDDIGRTTIAHIMLESRQYESVDSALADWRKSGVPSNGSIAELQMMLERERGQYARIVAAGKRITANEGLDFVVANSISRIGDYAGARAMYEKFGHPPLAPGAILGLLPTNDARLYSWVHALAADAYAPSGDTVALNALADSIETISQRSFYGRDLRLHHHVRGLVAMQRHAWREAISEFQQARWGGAGWTVTVADIARCYMQLNKPLDAVRVLRDGYTGPLDAMGRYEPRSELDFLMALAFQQAGMRDSAAVYGTYVRHAWQNADPPVRQQLFQLKQ